MSGHWGPFKRAWRARAAAVLLLAAPIAGAGETAQRDWLSPSPVSLAFEPMQVLPEVHKWYL
ncbi:MAG: hypothetical protein WDA75_10610, partial [Candidatus Latescibacterota bacterium]